jgi:excisionase family DNA binding protein
VIELRLKNPDASLVSYKEAAALIGVSTLTIRKLVESGEIVATKIGLKSVRLDVNSIKRFLDKRIIAKKAVA